MFDLDLDTQWDVSQDAECLNKSLFNPSKKKKSQTKKVNSNTPTSGLIYESEDETFTKKEMRRIKKKKRKEKRQKLDCKETPPQLKDASPVNLITKAKSNNRIKAEADLLIKRKVEKNDKKHKKKADDFVKKGRKRKRESMEIENDNSVSENTSKMKKKDMSVADLSKQSNEEPIKKRRKRMHKKKNNSKKNKYAHLALNRQNKESNDKDSNILKEAKPANITCLSEPKGERMLMANLSTSLLKGQDNCTSEISNKFKRKIKTSDESTQFNKNHAQKKASTISSKTSPSHSGSNTYPSSKNSKKETNLVKNALPAAKKTKMKNNESSASHELKTTLAVAAKSQAKGKQVKKNRDAIKKTDASEKSEMMFGPEVREALIKNLKLQTKLECVKGHMDGNELLKKKLQKKDKKEREKQKNTEASECKVVNEKESKQKDKLNINKMGDNNTEEKKVKEGKNDRKTVKTVGKLYSMESSSQMWKDNTSQDKHTSISSSVWGNKSLALGNQAREKLNSARFRYLNEQLYTCSGSQALQMFHEDHQAFSVYHSGFENQAAKWPVNPVNTIVKQLKQKSPDLVVADFGCGDAKLAQSLPQKVHSFDLVSLNPNVTACDMTKVPLQNESVDIAVFCLSLMGTNLDDYIHESNRVLKTNGLLKIVEVVSRFRGLSSFLAGICSHGFQLLNKRDLSDMFYMMDFKKVKTVKKAVSGKGLSLKPCLYKKR